MRKMFVIPFALVAAALIGVMTPLLGQGETIVTVAFPGWMNDVFNAELFEEFEAQTGAKVVAVPLDDQAFVPPPAFDLDEHLSGVEQLATLADVVPLNQSNLSPEAIAAGYYLDLMPLVQGDPSIDINDFFTGMWESMQWDGGMWGLPVSGDVQFVVYDRIAFDNAGLSYPNENWTFADFANAARALTVYDSEGNVEVQGFSGSSPGLMYRAFTGNVFYDPTQFPAAPQLNTPELATFLDEYRALMDEIRFGEGRFDYEAVPLLIEGPWRIASGNFVSSEGDAPERDWQVALLPGNAAGLSVSGFGVSGGTANPTLAYELASYLTRQPEVVNRFFGTSPARRSMVDAGNDEEQVFFGPEIPEEFQPIIDTALENAIPMSDLWFSDYVNSAMAGEEGESVETMSTTEQLETAQQNAQEALQTALDRGNTATVFVSTPVPTPVLGANEIILRFGVNAFSSQIPNRELWNNVISEFVANHPTVGNIDLIPPSFGPPGEDEPALDCEYQAQNLIQFEQFEVEETYINLDPFIDTDPTFDPNDFLNGVLDQVQRNGMTWAYPMMMQPDVMWYDAAQFADAGLPMPVGGWTVEAFTDALNTLQMTQDAEEPFPPFRPMAFNPNYIYMLAAAFGGLPYDITVDPPALNLTDPTSVNALRQVLDLAVNELMEYQELQGFGISGGGGGMMFGGPSEPPITTDVLSANSFRLQQRDDNDMFSGDWQLTSFPTGSQYTPVAYSVGVAMIHRDSADPMACYDWINTIAQHPELFDGVPVRRSIINDPAIATAQGEDVAALYREFVTLLDQPNVVVLPGSFGGGIGGTTPGAWLEPNWVNEAFNSYVLEGGDLDTLLAEAESHILTFRDCTSGIPEMEFTEETTEEEAQAYNRQFTDCAIAADPDITEEDFPWVYQNQP